MKTRATASCNNRQPVLFRSPGDARAQGDSFETRIRAFARTVALRQRHGRADIAGLTRALHGYYGALALFATAPLPPLDDAALRLALESYLAAKSPRHARAA